MLKGIPADVLVVVVAGMAVYMAMGAPLIFAVIHMVLCLYNAKNAPLVGKDGFFSKN